jgi:hypothetical protein
MSDTAELRKKAWALYMRAAELWGLERWDEGDALYDESLAVMAKYRP